MKNFHPRYRPLSQPLSSLYRQPPESNLLNAPCLKHGRLPQSTYSIEKRDRDEQVNEPPWRVRRCRIWRGVAVVEPPWWRHQQPYTAREGGEDRGKESWWSCLVCVCMYVGWRELSTQHDSPAGVTAYLRAARAAAWRSLSSLPASPFAFRRSDRVLFCTRLRAVMSKYGSTVDGWDCLF